DPPGHLQGGFRRARPPPESEMREHAQRGRGMRRAPTACVFALLLVAPYAGALRRMAAFVPTCGVIPLVPQGTRTACTRSGLAAAGMALRLPKHFQHADVRGSKIEPSLAAELGIRLGAVASFVAEGALVLDIGSDHGYLPIGLVKSGRAARVIAGELNRDPFLNAMSSVAAEPPEVAGRIEVDTITVSGIGGVTIARILFGVVFPDSDVRVALHHKGSSQLEAGAGLAEDTPARCVNDLPAVQRLVLQPTSGWPSLRRTLLCHGWEIVDEVIHRCVL
ncbi:MAG: tRNA (adenine(22)-N(1))-methyltransferase, partial [Promethearchaeia archaeon]